MGRVYMDPDDEIYNIVFRVSKDTYEDLVAVSKREDINMNDIVEYCLRNIVDEFS